MVAFRTISLPERLFRVREGTFDLDNFQTSSDSLLSRAAFATGLLNQRWACELEFASARRAIWQDWQATRASIRGRAVLFVVRAPARRLPLGAGAGFAPGNAAITIAGTTVTGTRILEGAVSAQIAAPAPRYAAAVKMQFPAALAGEVVLARGDLFGLGGNLYMVTGAVRPNSAGVARVPFVWKLWKGARTGDIVTFRDPTCRMQFRTDNEGRTHLRPPERGTAGFAAIEVPFVD